jgi:glutathione S-transferase
MCVYFMHTNKLKDPAMQLIIGNKNYSSWSLRAWIMMAKSGLDFSETKLVLDTPEFYAALKGITPSLKVPTLVDGDTVVWDSLAICEYINDAHLAGRAWPAAVSQRAKARAIACEMHSGFSGVRNEMPMNIRAKRRVELSEQALADIARIEQIWSEQYEEFAQKGGWLFGQWSIADAMFLPVVLRFVTYDVKLNEAATSYMKHVLACEDLKRWIDSALEETDIVTIDEAGEDR